MKEKEDEDSIDNKEFIEMADSFWEKEDPEFFKMMMKHRKNNVSDKKTT